MDEAVDKLKTGLEKIKVNMVKVNEMVGHVQALASHGFKVNTQSLVEQNKEYETFIQEIEKEILELSMKVDEKAQEVNSLS